jgi:hypothetical protein
MCKHFLPKCRRSGIERSKGIAEQNLITMFFHFALPERIKRLIWLICVPVLVQTLRLSSVRLLTVKLKQAFYNNMNIGLFWMGPLSEDEPFPVCAAPYKSFIYRVTFVSNQWKNCAEECG